MTTQIYQQISDWKSSRFLFFLQLLLTFHLFILFQQLSHLLPLTDFRSRLNTLCVFYPGWISNTCACFILSLVALSSWYLQHQLQHI